MNDQEFQAFLAQVDFLDNDQWDELLSKGSRSFQDPQLTNMDGAAIAGALELARLLLSHRHSD